MNSLAAKLELLQDLRPFSSKAVASLEAAWDVKMVYESNAIEGNSLTLRETEIVLSKGVTISGKPLKDHLEAVNLMKAWDWLKEQIQQENQLTETDLLQLHRIVMLGIDDESAGTYRAHQVRIAGSNHLPPDAIKVPELMENLFADLAEISDPLERAAAAHYGIAQIHPFHDGNGRTARLMMNFILMAAGYPPISISPAERTDYYAALESADRGEKIEWMKFLSVKLDRELDDYLTILKTESSKSKEKSL